MKALPALTSFAAVRLTGVLMATSWSLHLGRDPRPVFGVYNDLAFLPLFPGLIRAVSTVLSISPVDVALLIAWSA